MKHKVGDILICKSLYVDGNRGLRAECIHLGQKYQILDIVKRNGEEYLTVMSTLGKVPYHPSHFTSVKEERKQKLEKLKEYV